MALRVCRKYNSVLYSCIGWEIDKLSSTPFHHTPSFAPTDHPYTLSLCLLGRSVGEPEGVGGGGRGAELVNQPPYVRVQNKIILAANVQCHIRINNNNK